MICFTQRYWLLVSDLLHILFPQPNCAADSLTVGGTRWCQAYVLLLLSHWNPCHQAPWKLPEAVWESGVRAATCEKRWFSGVFCIHSPILSAKPAFAPSLLLQTRKLVNLIERWHPIKIWVLHYISDAVSRDWQEKYYMLDIPLVENL